MEIFNLQQFDRICFSLLSTYFITFQVTGLQTQNGSGHTSPNVAILAKLRMEMNSLADRKKSCMGKLTLNTSLMKHSKTTSEKNRQSNKNYDENSTASNTDTVNNVDQRINL